METLVGKVLAYADSQAEKNAVCFKNVTVSYGELKHRIMGMAAILRGMGVEKGHRVMLNAVSKPNISRDCWQCSISEPLRWPLTNTRSLRIFVTYGK